MQLDNHERKILFHALEQWQHDGRLTPKQAEDLKQTIVPKKASQQLATYFFVVALACALLSFGALFIDEKFLERFRQYFALCNWSITFLTSAFTAVWLIYIYRRRASMRPMFYDMQLAGASVVMLTALVYLCKETGAGNAYSGLLFLAATCFSVIHYFFQATATWVGLLLSLMSWYGAFSYANSTEHLFLGMNYPVRFTVFGIVLLLLSFLQARIKPFKSTSRITLVLSLLIFFTGLWGVSIFGNYNSLERWAEVRQIHILVYGVLMGIASISALIWGIKKDDAFTRDTGIIFLLLNLYTRYFEYFWDTLNKGLFFLIIAISFGLVGRWLMRRQKQSAA